PKPLRIVALSDTHGFQGSLQAEDIPRGDLLVHCGDFSPDCPRERRRSELERFDLWLRDVCLSRFQGRRPLVVRGNHDPGMLQRFLARARLPAGEECLVFPQSRALYLTRDCYFDIANGTVRVAALPWRPPLLGRRELRESVDVLLSHAPLLRPLDREALAAPRRGPKVHICGHVHMEAGSRLCRFGDDGATVLCVNAAMANDGIAA
ncbi:unnamed protein product, partial [Prorocentrum cordatum]